MTGATTPVWLRLDKDDPIIIGYDVMQPGWAVTIGNRKPLSGIYNEALEVFPQAEWFGFLSDDVVPRTHGWDHALIEAAGRHGIAAPSGGHEDFDGFPHFVLGGELVREIGWLALPGLDRLYIDQVWNDIGKAKGVLRHLPDVVLEHMHFSNGKAMMDATYRKYKKHADRQIYLNWRNGDYTQLLKGDSE